MAVPTDPDHNVTVRLSATGQPPVRDGVPLERMISVLFGTGIEEWRRGWRSSPGSGPSREAIVSASDTTRGSTATTQVVPGRRLAYTMLDASASLDRVMDAVSTYVDDFEGEAPAVVIDDIAPVITERGAEATRSFVTALRGLSGVGDVIVGCSYRPEVAADVRSVFDLTGDVGRVDHPVAGALDRLHRDDPTTFGYVRRHWAEARDGIERCTRNYPQSRQVHAALSDPETTPRTLGATLSGLVRLGVLDTWGETVGSTRYDLTAYDLDRMWVVGAVLAASADESGPDGGPETVGDD
ncbi:DUF7504 family protein [Halorubrum depositum]|uniref:DUF7504 family protein n=1 Tax=Halorubrum depositum TaxID=2583992 RepID=UPI00119F90C3|nr:hypothetical protein [Halorubrum depositum]